MVVNQTIYCCQNLAATSNEIKMNGNRMDKNEQKRLSSSKFGKSLFYEKNDWIAIGAMLKYRLFAGFLQMQKLRDVIIGAYLKDGNLAIWWKVKLIKYCLIFWSFVCVNLTAFQNLSCLFLTMPGLFLFITVLFRKKWKLTWEGFELVSPEQKECTLTTTTAEAICFHKL